MTISEEKWRRYFNLRGEGLDMAQASRAVGISYASAKARERRMQSNAGEVIRAANEQARLPEPVALDELSVDAARALEDFAYFRARFLGRISTPWQEEAAYRIVELLATPRKEYVVMNCPPGSGKSTLFTLDVPLWVTCRNRAIRGMIGSASATLAERYVANLRTVLESPYRFESERELVDRGLAVDAEATLAEDYGFFKPQPAALWSNKAFTVAQHGNRSVLHKEPTWSGYGLDSALIGGRYDLVVLDDIIDDADIRTLERIDWHRSRFDRVIEKRLEPGGVLVVQGQRLSPEDLYKYCKSKPAGVEDAISHEGCCSAEEGRKYHLITYPAHDESRCNNVHGGDAPYWPEGCLLDPRRLPWRELETEQANGLANFLSVYQQQDADPDQVLVNPLWVAGGTDPKTKEVFPGCWDNDRDLCELPPGITGPLVSVASIDPSPTKYWGITWWVWHPETDLRFLMDLERRTMSSADLLDWNNPAGAYTGLMEHWQRRSVELGWPITHWVFEANAAARFVLQTERFRFWASSRSVQVIAHQTSRTKQDPAYGPQRLGPLYRFGKVRLPGAMAARTASLKLIDEVTKWPLGRYSDLLMSQWFVEANLTSMWSPPRTGAARASRPSWLR